MPQFPARPPETNQAFIFTKPVLIQPAPPPPRPAARRENPVYNTPGHQSFLDGIRGIAALWVLLSHLWIIPNGLNARDNGLGRLMGWTLYSHFAVDIFIVLSGFCLILPAARSGRLPGGAAAFFGRRARRILPPFYAALFLSLAAVLGIQALGHQPLQVSRPALLANVFLVQDVFPSLNSINGPFWSIAVEWRIYFLFPVLVYLLARWGRRGVLLVSALCGGGATILLLRWQPGMFLACPWYLGLFALGVCTGSLSAGSPRRGEKAQCQMAVVLSLAALAALVHAHPITASGCKDFGAYLPVIDTFAGAGAAAALLQISRMPQRFPLLSWPPLAALGTFAYSLYLVHMPCLLLGNALVKAFVPSWNGPLHRVLALALALPLVVGLARLFFFAFERPFLTPRIFTPRTAGAAAGERLAAGSRDARTKSPA